MHGGKSLHMGWWVRIRTFPPDDTAGLLESDIFPMTSQPVMWLENRRHAGALKGRPPGEMYVGAEGGAGI